MDIAVNCLLEGCIYNEYGTCSNEEIHIDVNGSCEDFSDEED